VIMQCVIYSGVDWSGSPGREPHDPLLVLAIVHFDEHVLPNLERELATARAALRLPPTYPFKHLSASAAVHSQVFAALGRLAMQAHVHIIDKTTWTGQYIRQSSGPDRICDGLITLVLGCPNAFVAKQQLFVDLDRKKDMPMVRNQRTALSQALKGAGRQSFKNVQPCPDHRLHGGIIQVADMIAGEVHQQGGLTGPYLPALGTKVRVV
jgi:hypothetical protein